MKKYTLIGHPLGHSMSPFIHDRLFKLKGREVSYSLTDISPEDLNSKKEYLKSEFVGYNITIPHKVAVIPFIDKMDTSALRYNSVNCVANTQEGSIGYNTDCYGFLNSLKMNDISLDGKVLLLGCGGVGRMMAIESLLHGATLTIAIIEEARDMCNTLLAELNEKFPNVKVEVVLMSEITGSFDLVINSTPVGMFPKVDNCPLSDETISKCGAVFDAIYNPTETKLVQKFKAQGKKAVGGMAMLVLQAVKAHELWDNDTYSNDEIDEIIKQSNEKVEKDFQ
ncbi:MAG: shikimate dehydrogenase [Ruminococcus sp.]|nr:shikimate dehydrogenase [Ruminococcus sp.]